MNHDNIISFSPQAVRPDEKRIIKDRRVDEAFGAVKHAIETLKVARQHTKQTEPDAEYKHVAYRCAAEHLWEALGDLYSGEKGGEAILWSPFLDDVK